MLPSFHDDYVVRYEVDCEGREIRLHIKSAASVANQAGVSTVVFTGVEGYNLDNDAFGNIVLDLETVTTTAFVSQHPRRACRVFPRFGSSLSKRPTQTRQSFVRRAYTIEVNSPTTNTTPGQFRRGQSTSRGDSEFDRRIPNLVAISGSHCRRCNPAVHLGYPFHAILYG